mgnify:CR=1 FL=1
MKTPIVSICCITYNHESYIRDCLEGFIMQKTNFAFEVLIHDDASTDKTADIIRDYEAKYPEILKPIYQKENQYSKGINPGTKFLFPRARAKYIALCEGDDYWTDPYKLQKQVDFLEANQEYSMCFHKVDYVDELNDIIEFEDYNKDTKTTTTFEDLCKSNYINTCSNLFRNNELITNWPSALADCFPGDWVLNLLMCGKNGLIYMLEEKMASYRIHSQGIWSKQKKDAKKLELISTSKYKVYKYFDKNKTLKRTLSIGFIRLSNQAFIEKKYGLYLRSKIKAIYYFQLRKDNIKELIADFLFPNIIKNR